MNGREVRLDGVRAGSAISVQRSFATLRLEHDLSGIDTDVLFFMNLYDFERRPKAA